jgi:hypothetical protein
MLISSFKQCESKYEERKIKKIYFVAFIIFLVIFYGLSFTIKDRREQEKIFSLFFIWELFFAYLTIWAASKLGIKRFWAILLGIVTFIEFEDLFPLGVVAVAFTILNKKLPRKAETKNAQESEIDWRRILILSTLIAIICSVILFYQKRFSKSLQLPIF